MTASASRSPSRAANWTCSPRTASGSPSARSSTRLTRRPTAASRARRARPEPDAYRSQHPRRPQTHGGPYGSTTMWPNSPVNPLWPRWSAPPATTPPPMPVPSVTRIMSSDPRPAPRRHSASAAHVASLSTRTGQSSCARNPLATSKSATPSRFGAARSTPLRVTIPGTPIAERLVVPERPGELDERVDHPVDAAGAARRRTAILGDDVAIGVERDTEALRSADVDADVKPRSSHAGRVTPRRAP